MGRRGDGCVGCDCISIYPIDTLDIDTGELFEQSGLLVGGNSVVESENVSLTCRSVQSSEVRVRGQVGCGVRMAILSALLGGRTGVSVAVEE